MARMAWLARRVWLAWMARNGEVWRGCVSSAALFRANAAKFYSFFETLLSKSPKPSKPSPKPPPKPPSKSPPNPPPNPPSSWP
jgi:hypothetical protein